MGVAPVCHCPHILRCDGKLLMRGNWHWIFEFDDRKLSCSIVHPFHRWKICHILDKKWRDDIWRLTSHLCLDVKQLSILSQDIFPLPRFIFHCLCYSLTGHLFIVTGHIFIDASHFSVCLCHRQGGEIQHIRHEYNYEFDTPKFLQCAVRCWKPSRYGAVRCTI